MNRINKQTIRRLPNYLSYALNKLHCTFISSSDVSQALNIDPVVIRKDITSFDIRGTTGCGFPRVELIKTLMNAIGIESVQERRNVLVSTILPEDQGIICNDDNAQEELDALVKLGYTKILNLTTEVNLIVPSGITIHNYPLLTGAAELNQKAAQ